MKSKVLALLLFTGAFAPALFSATAPAPKYPPFIITDSELRVLPPATNGRAYQLAVRLPASYAQETDRRYPVLFVTDGYWDFPTIVTGYDNLVFDKVVPECIIVGLGYAGENLDYGKLRGGELSPAPLGFMDNSSGHAAEFLATLEQTIIPFIAQNYRVDPSYRVLAGSSLGGLFTLYVMYTKPELFQGYIAASPAVIVHNDWLFGYEAAFAKSGQPIKARLFMTGAENENPGFLDGIKRFSQQISSRKYPGFTYGFRLIDGERHAGTKSESYVRGLRFVFAPLAPESGPSK
jgi:predicted alpha/beta superfamily hydrolase